jgi:hypothetical protein
VALKQPPVTRVHHPRGSRGHDGRRCRPCGEVPWLVQRLCSCAI